MRLRSLWLLLPVATACVTPSLASRPDVEDHGIDAPLPGEGPAPMVIVDRGEPPPPQTVQREYIYYGGHPIPDEYGGGWCIEEGPHAHPYLPVAQDQYTSQQGGFAFRDDVEWWDYDYEHPIPVEYGGGWCGLAGIHHHHYRPWLTYWWNPERRAYAYVSDTQRVAGQKVVRGTPPRERRPPRVIAVPTTPVPPSGTVARPVPVSPTNNGYGGAVARPVPVEPPGSGSSARPVPVQPSSPIVRPAETNEPRRFPDARPAPIRPIPGESHPPIVRPQPIEFDLPSSARDVTPARPPVVTSPPPGMPLNPSRPPMVEPARPRVETRPRYEPPTYHEPPPVMNPHSPTTTVRNAPAPVYNAPAPVRSMPAPVYNAPAPVRSAAVPVYNAPASVHSAPTAAHSTSSSTRSVIPVPSVSATSSKKSAASVVRTQRR